MRADGLVEGDEFAAHAPAGNAVCAEVLVDADGDVDDGGVGALFRDCAAVVVVSWGRLAWSRCVLGRQVVGRGREQWEGVGLMVFEGSVGLLVHDDSFVKLVGFD